jgi:hypothetical protein
VTISLKLDLKCNASASEKGADPLIAHQIKNTSIKLTCCFVKPTLENGLTSSDLISIYSIP